MKKNFKIFISIVLLGFSFLPMAYSAPNIDGVMSYTDANDWGGGLSITNTNDFKYSDWYPTYEAASGTILANVVVEEGDAAGVSNYDVEELGVYIEDNWLYIGLQTQYDISTPANSTGVVNAGDFIFIFGDENDDTLSDYDLNNDGYYNGNYDYAFAFDFTVKADESVDITYLAGTMSGTGVGSDYNNYGTDWGIQSASTIVNGSEIVYSYGYSDEDAGSKDNCYPDGVYTLELAIDLNSLSGELSTLLNSPGDHDSLAMYWQPSCGNDFLAAKTDFDYTTPPGGATNPTPEPATMLLFGMGLLGASAWGRRRRRSEKFD